MEGVNLPGAQTAGRFYVSYKSGFTTGCDGDTVPNIAVIGPNLGAPVRIITIKMIRFVGFLSRVSPWNVKHKVKKDLLRASFDNTVRADEELVLLLLIRGDSFRLRMEKYCGKEGRGWGLGWGWGRGQEEGRGGGGGGGMWKKGERIYLQGLPELVG